MTKITPLTSFLMHSTDGRQPRAPQNSVIFDSMATFLIYLVWRYLKMSQGCFLFNNKHFEAGVKSILLTKPRNGSWISD